MRVVVNRVPFNVIVGHCVGEFRNADGESRKEVTAVNVLSGGISTYTTYENPVTEDDFREFLEDRI